MADSAEGQEEVETTLRPNEKLISSEPSSSQAMLSSPYLMLLIVRFACILLPGFLQKTEFAEGQEGVYNMLMRTQDLLMDVPAGMVSDPPTTSAVPAMITSYIPFAVMKYLTDTVDLDMFGSLSLLLPRVWMFFISIAIDFLTLQSLNFIGGVGRQGVANILATSWATIVFSTRPSRAIVEALAVSGGLASLLTFSSDLLRFPAFMAFFALGIFCRSSFLIYGLLLLYFVFVSAMKPENQRKLVPLIGGIVLGAVSFLVFFVGLAVIDSLFYGSLKLTAGGVTYDNLSQAVRSYYAKELQWLSPELTGGLLLVPFNSLSITSVSSFRDYLAKSMSAGQMFFYFPLAVGPLAVVLGMDSYDSFKKLFKEVMAEVRGSSAGGKRKKKTKKMPETAKAREEDSSVYADAVEMTLTLGLTADVIFGSMSTGFLTALPQLHICALMFGDKIFGPRAYKNMWKWWYAYNVLAVAFFGIMHNSGPVQLTKSLANGELIASGDSQPVIHFYNTYKPADYLLDSNPVSATFLSHNLTTVDNLYAKVLSVYKEDESRTQYVAVPGTTPLTEEQGFTLATKIPFHLSLEHPPRNIDALFQKSTMNLYSIILDAGQNDDEETDEASDTKEEADADSDDSGDTEKEDL